MVKVAAETAAAVNSLREQWLLLFLSMSLLLIDPGPECFDIDIPKKESPLEKVETRAFSTSMFRKTSATNIHE
jgi:hypothetical protein